MHIIPVTGDASIVFLPFHPYGTDPVVISVTDENRNKTIYASQYTIAAWGQDSNYYQWDMNWVSGMGDLTRTEGNYFSFKVLQGADTIYLGQIYCTNTAEVDFPKYTLNSNQYIEQAGNNEFIVF